MAKKGKKGKIEGVHLYDPGASHFIFFVCSVLLVVLWFAMIGQDYAREWKQYQREFFDLETEQIEVDLEEEEIRIEEDLIALEEDLEEAEIAIDEQSDVLSELQAQKADLALRLSSAERELKFEKARQDERRYNVEAGLMKIAEHDYEQYHAALAYGMDKDPTTGHYGESELELLEQVPAWEGFAEGGRLIAEYTENVKALNAEMAALDAEILNYTGTKEELLAKRKALTLGITRLEDRKKKVDRRFSNIFRGLPMLDFMAPQLKIQQTVVDDIHFDVNFMGIDAVDRCQTCHIAIDKPGYEDMPNPLKTHPKLVELFTGGIVEKDDGTTETIAGKHPFEQFGCTGCHAGRGRMTSFIGAAHTPNDHEQEQAWIDEYGWFDDHYWDFPQVPKKHLYSSCYQCHAGNPVLPLAEEANHARALATQSGCFSCHKIGTGGFTELPKPGPNLAHLSSKTTPEWTWKWLQAPREFRKETLMPHYWGLLNNSKSEEDKIRNEVEIHSIVTYLYETSEPLGMPRMAIPRGDAEKGEEIVNVKGCFGCHQVGWDNGVKRWEPRHHGPNLAGVGSKVSREWLYWWIQNPNWYHADTRMPDLRLSSREITDVVAYLMTLTDESFDAKPVPPRNEEVLRSEVKWRLMDAMSEADAEAEVAGMSVKDLEMFLASKLIGRYGCFSCHNLNGPPGCGPVDEGGNGKPCFTDYGPIGTELTTEANKSIEKLDFGHVHIPHTKPDWFYTKLRTPRVWDTGKVVAVKDRLRMPSFGFSPDEAELLTGFILGLKKNVIGPTKLADQDAGAEARNRGHRLVESLNCRGCHIYEGAGGAIRPVVSEWLQAHQDMDEATAAGYYPPEISGEGAKVQSDWLIRFLQEPWEIRPWMKVVMPTFQWNQDKINQTIAHFNASSDVDTFEVFHCEDVDEASIEAGRKLASDKYYKCFSCHIQGDRFPAGSPDRWAPDFAMVPERLRHDWIIEWLQNPNDLMPGTKMPQFFYGDASPYKDILGGSNAAQMKALADYLRCGQDAGALRAKTFSSPPAGTSFVNTSSAADGQETPAAGQEAKL